MNLTNEELEAVKTLICLGRRTILPCAKRQFGVSESATLEKVKLVSKEPGKTIVAIKEGTKWVCHYE